MSFPTSSFIPTSFLNDPFSANQFSSDSQVDSNRQQDLQQEEFNYEDFLNQQNYVSLDHPVSTYNIQNWQIESYHSKRKILHIGVQTSLQSGAHPVKLDSEETYLKPYPQKSYNLRIEYDQANRSRKGIKITGELFKQTFDKKQKTDFPPTLVNDVDFNLTSSNPHSDELKFGIKSFVRSKDESKYFFKLVIQDQQEQKVFAITSPFFNIGKEPAKKRKATGSLEGTPSNKKAKRSPSKTPSREANTSSLHSAAAQPGVFDSFHIDETPSSQQNLIIEQQSRLIEQLQKQITELKESEAYLKEIVVRLATAAQYPNPHNQ